MTHIVAAFPGTGRTTFMNEHRADESILDIDSPPYSWIQSAKGKERNPDFPSNYIQAISAEVGRASLILVSTHQEVRDALLDHNIDYSLVYPSRESEAMYLEGFRTRGHNEAFIDLIASNWDVYLEQLEQQPDCHHIQLQPGQYLGDVIEL